MSADTKSSATSSDGKVAAGSSVGCCELMDGRVLRVVFCALVFCALEIPVDVVMADTNDCISSSSSIFVSKISSSFNSARWSGPHPLSAIAFLLPETLAKDSDHASFIIGMMSVGFRLIGIPFKVL
mgnify:CR=1 FL=1